MRRLSALVVALCALTAAGCGGDDPEDRSTAPSAGATVAPAEPPRSTPTPEAARPGQDPLALPPGVPSTPLRPRTSDEDREVIKAWAAALGAGDVREAAGYFAQPSLVQNGTPVIRLDTARSRLAFNLSLPCGAAPVRFGSGNGFSIVEFELRERPGGDCGGATGQRARCAIKVDDGRITEWYRLPDDPSAPAAPPEIEPGSASEA